MKKEYCFASNKYLASYINTSERTISNSLSKLKTLKYIIVKYENMKRRIYINSEKISIKVSKHNEKNCSSGVAESCYHNINNKYKKEYNNKSSLPYWMDNPECIKKKIPNEEEMKEFDELLDEFNDEEGEI